VKKAGLAAWIDEKWRWLRGADLTVPAALIAIGVLAVVFLKIAHEVSERDTHDLDERILLAFRDAPDDPKGSYKVEAGIMHISALGSGVVTTLVSVLAVGFLWLARRRRYALLVAACALGTAPIMVALKNLYGRERPTVVTHLDPPGGLSFPSGHSMISTALYITLAVMIARTQREHRLRRYIIGAGCLLALMVGLSRMYLGVHYPSDVVAGWTAGLAWAITCSIVAHLLGRRGQVEVPPTPPEPEA
jgi:undecaprenyl-diphosphatase